MSLVDEFRAEAREKDGWVHVHLGAWERLLAKLEELEWRCSQEGEE